MYLVWSRSIDDPQFHYRSAEQNSVNVSAGRLVGENASDVSREMEEILLEPALIVGLLVLSDGRGRPCM